MKTCGKPLVPIHTRMLSLNEVLRELGYKTVIAEGNYRKYVLKDRKTLFVGTAGETWQWLRERGDII
jgi:hypothetical protein